MKWIWNERALVGEYNFYRSTYDRKSFDSALRILLNRLFCSKSPSPTPAFRSYDPIAFLIPNILIFLKSGCLGEHSPHRTFLGYGKKSNFRAGTPNLSIKWNQSGVCMLIHDNVPLMSRSRMVLSSLSNLENSVLVTKLQGQLVDKLTVFSSFLSR